MADLQTEFANARRALTEGRLDAAEDGLRGLLAARPGHPLLAHLAAQILKKRGRPDAARAAYEQAIAGRPADAALHAEYASLLDDLGEGEASVAAYDRALALAPAMVDAAIDRGIVLTKRVDPARGIEALRDAVRNHPNSPRAWLTLALTLRRRDELDEAETAIERAVALAPRDAKALLARAQMALDRGKPSSQLFRAAREVAPANRELVLGETGALLQEGRLDEAEGLLVSFVESDPGWHDAQHMLARLRWQRGDGADFARGYRAALRERPGDAMLWVNLATITQRALGEAAALAIVEDARAALGGNAAINNVEANIRSEMGELDRAAELFARIDRADDSGLGLGRIRFLIRRGELEEAARRGLALVESGAGEHAWPYVSVIWRKLGDPRWGWLEGDRDFPGVFDLDALIPELPALSERLRALHRWQVHPFEQSLRGGTQTDNILFLRAEPEIRSLVGHIREAVRGYIDALPPVEPGHPVLDRPRGDFRFTGSWSVRLTDAGFHVNHTHSRGWISSALYVALPETIGTGEDHAGWLTLGEPQPELGLDLPPVRMVEPKPGRLALFPSIMWHGTRPFPAGERLTVAFDVGAG